MAIILPPLGVFLKFGCQVELFWIHLVLTLFGSRGVPKTPFVFKAIKALFGLDQKRKAAQVEESLILVFLDSCLGSVISTNPLSAVYVFLFDVWARFCNVKVGCQVIQTPEPNVSKHNGWIYQIFGLSLSLSLTSSHFLITIATSPATTATMATPSPPPSNPSFQVC